MTASEFRAMLALIWGQHGAQAAAARHFGVADRTVRRWAAGDVRVPRDVAAELRRLADRAPLPPIPAPPGGTSAYQGRDAACAEALSAAYAALVTAAELAGWAPHEILTALRRLAVTNATNGRCR